MKLSGRPSSFETMRPCNYYSSCCYATARTLSDVYPKFLDELIFDSDRIFIRESTFYVYLEIFVTILRRKIKLCQFCQMNSLIVRITKRRKYRCRKIDGSVSFIGKMDQL